jgi:hypothetical protein
MLIINKSNMNEMITLEEAETILVMAKRIYPQLNGLTVIEGEEFAYWHYNKEYNCESPFITIPFMPFDERMESVSDFIIGHVNKEFNSNISNSLKAKTINAFCHEIGHALDRANGEMLDPYYNDDMNEGYENFYEYANDCYIYLDSIKPDSEEFSPEFAEELVYAAIDTDEEIEDDKMYDLLWERFWDEHDEIMKELDKGYRMIPAEYRADEFSAYFMNTHLRYIPELFN